MQGCRSVPITNNHMIVLERKEKAFRTHLSAGCALLCKIVLFDFNIVGWRMAHFFCNILANACRIMMQDGSVFKSDTARTLQPL